MGTIVVGGVCLILIGAAQYRQEPAAGWLPPAGLSLDVFLFLVITGGGFA